MELDRVLQLADMREIDFLSGDILAAIFAIDSTANIDRRNPQAVAAHNATVLAAHRIIDDWMKNAPYEHVKNRKTFLEAAGIRIEPSLPSSSAAFPVIPGAEGHTHPIGPENEGTGLLREGKTPRYDKWGHVI